MYMTGNNSDRPGTIACVLTKLSKNSKLGLTFKREKKRVVIKEVKGISRRQTCLVPGLTVLSIGGVSIESGAQAKLMMETAPKGSNIPILVEGQIFETKKMRRNQQVGLTFKYVFEEKYGEVRVVGVEIAAVSDNSMFPYIPVGHHVFAINGKRVTKIEECMNMLRRTRNISLLIVAPPPTATKQQQRSEKVVVKPENMPASPSSTSTPTISSTTSSIPSVIGDEEIKSASSDEVVSEEVASGCESYEVDNVGAKVSIFGDEEMKSVDLDEKVSKEVGPGCDSDEADTVGAKDDTNPEDHLPSPQCSLRTNQKEDSRSCNPLGRVCGSYDDTMELITKMSFQEIYY